MLVIISVNDIIFLLFLRLEPRESPAALLLITEETFGIGYQDWTAWLIFIAAFIATKWLKLSPILMILSAAIIGLIIY